MQTTVRRDRDGSWEAVTNIHLADTSRGRRVLNICTSKHGKRISTMANVHHVKDGILTWELFGDFRFTMAESVGRCTEKTVAEQHQRAMAGVDAVTAAAKLHYLNKSA